MPRPARLLLSQSYYHIMTRGNNRNVVFREDDDYQQFMRLLHRFKDELPFDLYHYCLMPNHTHLLIRTSDAHGFAVFMKKLNLSYFHYYRRKYGWVGHFWQDRYKSQPVGKDSYFIQCGKYIELNPVRANLVDRPEYYPYSSYSHYALAQNDDLISDDFLYLQLGSTPAERRLSYSKLVIGDEVYDQYKKPIWAAPKSRYNEAKKITNHRR